MADDDGLFGKGQEFCQASLGGIPSAASFSSLMVMDVVGRADGSSGFYISVELIDGLPFRIEADGGDLDDFILRRVGACAFDVEETSRPSASAVSRSP